MYIIINAVSILMGTPRSRSVFDSEILRLSFDSEKEIDDVDHLVPIFEFTV